MQKAKGRRLIQMPRLNLVVKVFEHKKMIEQAVYERRNDTISHEGMPNNGGHGYAITSPTENNAIKNVLPLLEVKCDDGFWVRFPEKWLWVIRKAVNLCDDERYRKAIEMWIDGQEAGYIAEHLGISKTSYYDVRKEVQHYALALAAQCKLINLVRKEGNNYGRGNSNQENNQENNQEKQFSFT